MCFPICILFSPWLIGKLSSVSTCFAHVHVYTHIIVSDSDCCCLNCLRLALHVSRLWAHALNTSISISWFENIIILNWYQMLLHFVLMAKTIIHLTINIICLTTKYHFPLFWESLLLCILTKQLG